MSAKPAPITPEILRAARFSSHALASLERARRENEHHLWREIGAVDATGEKLARLCREASGGDDERTAQTILAAYTAAESE